MSRQQPPRKAKEANKGTAYTAAIKKKREDNVEQKIDPEVADLMKDLVDLIEYEEETIPALEYEEFLNEQPILEQENKYDDAVLEFLHKPSLDTKVNEIINAVKQEDDDKAIDKKIDAAIKAAKQEDKKQDLTLVTAIAKAMAPKPAAPVLKPVYVKQEDPYAFRNEKDTVPYAKNLAPGTRYYKQKRDGTRTYHVARGAYKKINIEQAPQVEVVVPQVSASKAVAEPMYQPALPIENNYVYPTPVTGPLIQWVAEKPKKKRKTTKRKSTKKKKEKKPKSTKKKVSKKQKKKVTFQL